MTSENTTLWCVLRTAGPTTLPLVRSLNADGIAAWAPTMIARRQRPRSNKRIEIAAPIVPTFAFAPAEHLIRLLELRSARISRHPAFSVLRDREYAAIVHDRQLDPLRQEEGEAAAKHAVLLRAEAEKLERSERAALLRTEAQRRKALRAVRRKDIPIGEGVMVADPSPFAGLVGRVQSGNGKTFVVSFGGSLNIEIEAWQLIPSDVFPAC